MSSERKRRRWRRAPLLVEENLTIDSTSTTTKTQVEEKKHIENVRRQWYNDDGDDERERASTPLSANESIAEKIDRVLKKINAWTNEASASAESTSNHLLGQQDTSLNRTTKSSSNYDNLRQASSSSYYADLSKTTTSTSLPHGASRRRCLSSTNGDLVMIPIADPSAHRPYSMTFVDEPFPVSSSCHRTYANQRLSRKVTLTLTLRNRTRQLDT